MRSEWHIQRIGEFAKVKGGKRMPAGTALVPHKTSHPYLRIVDFRDGGIDESALMYVPAEVFPAISRYTISSSDIYVSIVGTIGLVGQVPPRLDGANLTENAAKVTDLQSHVTSEYVRYYLQSPEGQHQIRTKTVGSTQPKLALFRIEEIEVPIPPLPAQREITSLLQLLEARIALLRKTNPTLECIAQALFKSWFIDFDPVRAKAMGREPDEMDAATAALFPAEFEESTLGLIPKGWAVAAVDGVAKIVKGRSYKSSELAESETALVTLKSFERGGGFRRDGFKGYTGTYKSEQIVQVGECIVAFTDVTQQAEVIGRAALVLPSRTHNKLVASLDVGIVRPSPEGVSPLFLYFLLQGERYVSHIRGFTSGTTVLHLAKDGVPSFRFALPPLPIVQAFTATAQALWARRVHNETMQLELAALRDSLLPRLISGKLRLSEAQAQLEEAIA